MLVSLLCASCWSRQACKLRTHVVYGQLAQAEECLGDPGDYRLTLTFVSLTIHKQYANSWLDSNGIKRLIMLMTWKALWRRRRNTMKPGKSLSG